MKLWEKNIKTDKLIEQFTVGRDRELDLLLAPYDALGSIAHIIMLNHIGLLNASELTSLRKELAAIYLTAARGEFIIEAGVEDVHSQIELMLTRRLGDAGKKIHAARSRNDQVLLDIKLFIRDKIQQVAEETRTFFDMLISRSNRFKDYLMPGYTHLQVAMPSSFGLWFGAHAENLADDMLMLQTAYRIADQNPLGSAAGYGSSFPIDRHMTTELLGFGSMNFNAVNAQMSRGRTERIVAFALSSLAGSLAKLAGDVCLFNSQNFGFITLPDELTTGSSIMPHKKNPDVFELIRAKCNKIQALPGEVEHILINLPTGYFRDMQVIKESFLPVFEEIINCLQIATYAVEKITPSKDILLDERYRYIFSVEEVNRQVLNKVPFREAYKAVAARIANGTYIADANIQHTHVGSIGNLANEQIEQKMNGFWKDFHFERKNEAYRKLLNEE